MEDGKDPKNPTLSEVGEKAVIDTILRTAPSTRNGDDAAVLDYGAPNSRMVVTTDMLVEERHFTKEWSNPAEIGRKAITQNFADVEAMGARPVAALLSLSAPGFTRLQFVSELARGINERISDYGAELIGGDMTDGEYIVISVTAIGQLGGPLEPLHLRNARPGQIVVASGGIGESATGHALLARLGREAALPEFESLLRAHCSTIMPPGRGYVARSAGVSAMTDNSDGLVRDIHAIAAKSKVAINLDSQAIGPTEDIMRACEILEEDPWKFVLSGGEDHTLIGTTFGPAPTGFRAIGTVLSHHPQGLVTVDSAPPRYQEGWGSF
ncbi:thiamine-phosphate kinase [Corynebacterium sp. ES2794-CONJ1]|uniref:thiamine-phosphate kinase n=1 Tax=unclassified Corynebacterium TaxID=2624378 RepID=UPI00216A9CB5|nr:MULTISPECIES: thiamine-phosphate kinase [unclassified Corynebacterium]MCS4490724.1 thiamine-phosphate kinase [Corynebacterium sp. ES2775-CONJ]MCS4532627.1 thiamine-phosphate kinase [Corynebacterium sp. ES2730-CONJ]MCU9520022.1 thiamine-phosphate kinase [Corynebacterium sp. ES2794-CONJ1]